MQGDIVGAGDVVLHVFGGEKVEQTEQHASKEEQPVDATVALAHAVTVEKVRKERKISSNERIQAKTVSLNKLTNALPHNHKIMHKQNAKRVSMQKYRCESLPQQQRVVVLVNHTGIAAGTVCGNRDHVSFVRRGLW